MRNSPLAVGTGSGPVPKSVARVRQRTPQGLLHAEAPPMRLCRVDNVLGAWPGLFKLWESRPGHCLVMSHTGANDHAELLLRLAVRLRGQFAEVRAPGLGALGGSSCALEVSLLRLASCGTACADPASQRSRLGCRSGCLPGRLCGC